MAESELPSVTEQTVKVPVTRLTADYLIEEKGFDPTTARVIVEYANLLTGSNRIVDEEFLDVFQGRTTALQQQGITVRQETVEIDPHSKTPIRKYYTADWQRTDTDYVPRGQRGEPSLNFPILEKSFVITNQKKLDLKK